MQGGRRRGAAQFENLVLELKLSAFEFGQFQLVNGGMDEGFFNFLVESVVALLERGQMIFERHAELPVEVLARQGVCHSFSISRRPSRLLGANFMKLRCRSSRAFSPAPVSPALPETAGQPIFAQRLKLGLASGV